jgi:methylated-DNA-[protein]-cysteine S-methyltransferase
MWRVMLHTWIPSPVGDLLAISDGTSLTQLAFDDEHRLIAPGREDARALSDVRAQLEAYFAGELREFDLPLAPAGSAFEQRVWGLLRTIAYGNTATYGEIARRVGAPNAARAVGSANGRNPIAIVIPCHRVIGADGSLTGYGGGLARKQLLLELETRRSGLFQPILSTQG